MNPVKEVILTTTDNIEGYSIKEYIDVILINCNPAGTDDLVKALKRLEKLALKRGGNAIIGISVKEHFITGTVVTINQGEVYD